MDITDVPLWQWIVACWITTWGLVVFRPWPVLHLIVYILCINFVLIVVGIPITLYDNSRDRWVKAYVNGVGKK